VSGQLSKPQDPVPVAVDVAKKPAKTEMAPKQQQNPLAGFEKIKDGDDGFGSNLGTVPDNAKPVPNKVDGVNTRRWSRMRRTPSRRSTPSIPGQGRRTQTTHTRPAIFEDNQFGTSNMGAIAYSAKWSSYGAYLHKMMEAIQIQWERILIDSRTEPPSGTYVTVKFTWIQRERSPRSSRSSPRRASRASRAA
jgi:hypothetical protein